MKQYPLLVSAIVLFHTISFGQDLFYGLGLNYGYKSVYQSGGIGVYARAFQKLDGNFGYCNDEYSGNGYTGGIRYVPFNVKLQPFVGVQYMKDFGAHLSFSDDNGNKESNFKIDRCEFYVGEIGMMFKQQDEFIKNYLTQYFFVVSIGYRYSPYVNKAIFVNGYPPDIYENTLNQRIGNGFGASISIIVLFKKKSEL